MARPEPQDNVSNESVASSSSAGESESESASSSNAASKTAQDAAPGVTEQEYHTEESDESSSGDDESESSVSARSVQPSGPPLLPPALLNPLPSPASFLDKHINVPWANMTRKQKQAERLRSRRTKKRDFDRMQRAAEANGAIQAGKAAQLRRGVRIASDRVTTGRVDGKAQPQVSGRQRVVERRKKMVESKGKLSGKAGQKKSQSKPKR